MSNKVTFAAAGNGKTYSICKDAIELAKNKTNKHILLITYTHQGVRSLEEEYRKQNYGIIDKNVVIKTWYSFLLTEVIKPYQCMLKLKYKDYKNEYDFNVTENYINSIAFYQDDATPRWYCGRHIQYYLNSAKDIRKNSVSCLACKCIEHSEYRVINRIEGVYSNIFFDELQDYAGWDLEIFNYLFASDVSITCVGDYKQATFRTNNSPKYKQYRDEKIKDFFIMHKQKGNCSINYENSTRRFNHQICNFVNKIHDDKESTIIPSSDYEQLVRLDEENLGLFLVENKYIEQYCEYYSPTILRYNSSSIIGFNHRCNIFNYGNSKGATFERVIVVPVGTSLPFIIKQKSISSRQTRSKFYVACTRAIYSVVFSVESLVENEYFETHQIEIGSTRIPASKYICK